MLVSRINAALGARLGSQTSYQFRLAYCDFGTPRGGRRTVPILSPSPRCLGLPSRTTHTGMTRAPALRRPQMKPQKPENLADYLACRLAVVNEIERVRRVRMIHESDRQIARQRV